MSTDAELAELVGRRPDPRLGGEHVNRLPESVGRPAPPPRDPRRGAITALGATLTGATLVGGIVMIALGLLTGAGWPVPALGALLVATHWGWVHVAEITANSLESSCHRELLAGNGRWLDRVEPYARFSVRTEVGEDGSILIERIAHHPTPVGADRFSFAVEIETRELRSGEEPSAAVAERAELMRRQAAADTERERTRYEAAADAYRLAALESEDEQQRRAAVRAASQALSDQINANLREPPLVE